MMDVEVEDEFDDESDAALEEKATEVLEEIASEEPVPKKAKAKAEVNVPAVLPAVLTKSAGVMTDAELLALENHVAEAKKRRAAEKALAEEEAKAKASAEKESKAAKALHASNVDRLAKEVLLMIAMYNSNMREGVEKSNKSTVADMCIKTALEGTKILATKLPGSYFGTNVAYEEVDARCRTLRAIKKEASEKKSGERAVFGCFAYADLSSSRSRRQGQGKDHSQACH